MWVDVVVLSIVFFCPAVQDTVKVVTVVVVPAVNFIECATEPSSLKSLKVLDHATVSDPVLAHGAYHKLLYVNHPQLKLLLEAEAVAILMVEVFALNVREEEFIFHG